MLVIRLFRVGKKNQPSFKIVVADKRRPTRAGRFVEELGNWNPVTKEKVLRQERIKYWLSVGAKPSPTVFNLFVSEKIIEGKKIDVHKKSKKAEAAPEAKPAEPVNPEATAAARTPTAEAKPQEPKPATESSKKETPKEEAPKEEAKKEEPKKEEKQEEKK